MPNYLEKGAPMPASPGRCADLLYDVRQLRLSMQKQVDAIKERENEIEDYLISIFSVGDAGAVGQHHMGKVEVEAVPTISDWGVFCSWVRKNDRFDCLQKRLAVVPVKETMTDEDRVLPGLAIFRKKWISLTKV